MVKSLIGREFEEEDEEVVEVKLEADWAC